jgi:hypothetical protein
MPLSPNPLSKLTASLSQSLGAASAQAGGTFNNVVASIDKTSLNATVSRLAGEVGSGLNGATASLGNSFDQGMAAVKGLGGGVSGASLTTALNGAVGGGALGGIASQAQSLVSKVGTTVGSISNVGADIASTIDKLGAGNLAGGLMGAATSISKAAGMLNNLLSLGRGVNLPSNGELFQARGAVAQVSPIPGEDWRVRLDCNWELFDSPLFNNTLKPTGGLVWPYLPSITVATKANYTQIDPVHNNFPFQAYKNSMVDDIQISGEFSCETEEDAYYWIGATTFLRAVTKMFYGTGPNVGNPPIVCRLTGYGSNVFNSVPVVIKATSFDMKDDCQYIKVTKLGSPTWVPIMSTISVTVTPIYNRARLRQFSLEDFASGNTVSTVGFL